MRTRLAGTVMLSTVAFFVVAVLVSVGVLWWSGDIARGALIGVICGSAAAITFGAVLRAMGRSGERSGDEHKRSRSGHDR
jgi:ascorbate-specific PTS system EIIC-type component UlaA